MIREVAAGTVRRVASETPIITAKAVGTVQAAGWASRAASNPWLVPRTIVQVTAADARPPPTSRPARAPARVSPRHQIPSASNGKKVEAASAKASPTVSARLVRRAIRDSAAGIPTAITAPSRKPRTLALSRPRSRSWLSTPATETVSPLDVERKAAKAPAVSSAEIASPSVPGSIRSGRRRTTASVRPVISRSGPYTRPIAP